MRKLGVVAAFALLAFAVWWLQRGAEPALVTAGSRGTVTATTPDAAVADAGVSVPANAGDTAAIARREVGLSATEKPGRARLCGRCIDHEHAPVPGCTVELNGWSPDGSATGEPFKNQKITTGDDGRFAFEFEPPGQHEFQLWIKSARTVAVGSDRFALHPGAERDFGDVALLSGCSVHCRVADTKGMPRARAGVHLLRKVQIAAASSWSPSDYAYAETDAQGEADLGVCTATQYEVRVDDERLIEPLAIDLGPGQGERRVEVVVEAWDRMPRITGVVVDEEEKPVEGVEVSGSGTSCNFGSRSGADGAFTLRQANPVEHGPLRLIVQKRGWDYLQVPDPVRWGTEDLRLRLRHGLVLVVHAVEKESGKPVQDFAVRMQLAAGAMVPLYVGDLAPREAGHHEDGSVAMPACWRSPYMLVVEPESKALWRSALQKIDLKDPGPVHVTVAVPAAATRTLRLVTASGAAVADCRVELAEPLGEPVTAETLVLPLNQWEHYSGFKKAILAHAGATDRRGELPLSGPAGTLLALRVLGPGCVPQVVSDVRLDVGDPLVVTVAVGGTLRVVATPVDVIGALDDLMEEKFNGGVVGEDRERKTGLLLMRSQGTRRETLPGDQKPPIAFNPDGRLEYAGVPPGTWTLILCWQMGSARQSCSLREVELIDGATTEVALDLAALRPATLHGRIVLNGAPYSGQFMLRGDHGLGRNGNRMLVQGLQATDAEGSFTYRGRAGTYRISLPFGTESMEVLGQPEVRLAAGDVLEQVFTVVIGSLRVRFLDAEDKPVANLEGTRLMRGPRDYYARLPTSDTDGRSSLSTCEAGALHVLVMRRRYAAPAAYQEYMQQHPEDPYMDQLVLDLGTITVSEGKATEVDVRVPPAYFK